MRVGEAAERFENVEVKFRVIRRRKAARVLRRILIPQAYLLYLLTLFRPLGDRLFERHPVFLHTVFFLVFLPSVALFLLTLDSELIPRIVSFAYFIATYYSYYVVSVLPVEHKGALFLSALSLGLLSTFYFVTYPRRAEIEMLGFVGFKPKAPHQAFRYLRSREGLTLVLLSRLFGILSSPRLYLVGLFIFFLLKRHFLSPIDVVRTVSYARVNAEKRVRLRPAIVFPAEPRCYLIGTRSNLGFITFIVFSAATFSLIKTYEAFVILLYGSVLSGLSLVSAYALLYGFLRFDVYLVSMNVSGYERIVIVGPRGIIFSISFMSSPLILLSYRISSSISSISLRISLDFLGRCLGE